MVPIFISISLSSLSNFYCIFCSSKIARFYLSIEDLIYYFLFNYAFREIAIASALLISAYYYNCCAMKNYLSLVYRASL